MSSIVGDIIKTSRGTYEVVNEISVNRHNADVYLCVDEHDNKYAAKYFCNGTPMSNIGYNKKNHFGRRRDGSSLVFNELHEKTLQYNFLVKHYARCKHKNYWLILLEYVKGIDLREFLLSEEYTIGNKVLATTTLAKELAIWHNHDFAHGDPHTNNAILTIDNEGSYGIRLIDYSLLHHPDFFYCKKYKCFDSAKKRIGEDLKNQFEGQIATGFLNDLEDVQNNINIDSNLVEVFLKSYSEYRTM